MFFGDRGRRLSLYERLTLLLVTGGIPRYLEEINPRHTAEENIRRMCFSPGGLLFSEYDRLLNDLFQKKNKSYRQIIEALAERPLTLNELQSAIGKAKSGVLSADLVDLEKSGFLVRYYTWNPHTGRPSNQYKVRIRDNYLRFYLLAVKPRAEAIRSGSNELPHNLPDMLGLHLENLVLRNRRLLWAALKIGSGKIVRSGPYFQNATVKHRGCQIDYMIQTRRSLYVVEIKLAGEALGKEVIDAARSKIDCLVKPKRLSVQPVLVHINGVKESVLAEDFFDHVFDFGALASSD
jgi:uncharacterized protein